MQKVLFEWWKPTLYLLHLPRVKSGNSTGVPPLLADVSVNSTRQLQSAAS